MKTADSSGIVIPPMLYDFVVIPVATDSIGRVAEILRSLPGELPAPLLLPVRDRTPSLDSVAGTLRESVEREIVTIASGTATLRDGLVVLVPAERSLEINGNEMAVGEPPTTHQQDGGRAVESLARALGERLVGVIVDATGDAAGDIYDVHRHGGTVIVEGHLGQDVLPASVPPMNVDILAPRGGVSTAVTHLLERGSPPSEPLTSGALRPLLDDLRSRFGINFASYKEATIIRRMQRRMVDTGQTSLPSYRKYLQSHPNEYHRLMSSFLIKVTSFFRDPELYDYLQRHIVPDLIRHARDHDKQLRIWSAGCATGEEAYSLAILLAEALGDEMDTMGIRIFATDLDTGAIEFARRGVYPAAALDDIPPDLVDRYFARIDGEYQVTKRIRSLCIFGQHDLAERAAFPRIDLLVSRNVLIYFTPELQRRVLQLFASALRDDGYLALGKSESITPLPDYFTADSAQLRVYRRHGERMLVSPKPVHDAAPPRLSLRHMPQPPQSLESVRLSQDQMRPARIRERTEAALMHLPIGVIHVNAEYDIQFINSAARRLLQIHSTAIGDDLIHLAQDLPAREFRRAIDLALKEGQETVLNEVQIVQPATGQPQYVRISVTSEDTETGTVGQVLLEDITEPVVMLQQARQALQVEQEGTQALRSQVERLSETNQSLLAANQELTVTNMDLRAANEEFLVGNEELQAAAEEVETLNEEFQATNEELETLNEELQATVEELNATNEDLQSRSVELEELAVSLQAQRAEIDMERARLQAVLASMADAVIVVDTAGQTLLTNAAFDSMFPRPFQALGTNDEPLPTDSMPWMAAARGEDCELEFVVQDPDGTQRWFEARGRPIDGDRGTQGGVAVIRDITDRSVHRLQEEFMSVASHELRSPLTVLNGYLGMLQRSLDKDLNSEKLQDYVDQARHQTERLQLLVRDLVDVTRLRQGTIPVDLQPVDPVEVARQAVSAAQLIASDQAIEVQTPEASVRVTADPARLEQVLLNLLTNAATYAASSEKIELSVSSRDGEALIGVRDQGPGIAAEHLPHLFTRFYTAGNEQSDAGLGLGLYISHELVSAMNGSISVESEPGKGAAFTVCLPLSDRMLS